MEYQKFKPCSQLEPFVECYFVWNSQENIEPTTIESPPSGFCSIVFNYGDPYFLETKKFGKQPVPPQFISGQSIYSYNLFLEGKIGLCGIVFKPAALATIFNLPMYEYVEERIDLYKIFKKNVLDQTISFIKSTTENKEKVKILEAFLLQQYQAEKPEMDYIDKAANYIIEHNGMLQVNDLLAESCMSRRTFERKFFQKVGLSPKYYARIRRIGYLCNLIAGKKKVDWAKIFYEVEFYDHAHFIKDFQEFTGRSPQQYLNENTELANFVDKPITQTL
jgi:AraC-like DNA-binding protein